jgi:hypothetical protein|nr:MAG TPA: hypothetical protein [Caudoviricetes sp.]
MKYTENDIKVGTKMTCIDNNDTTWWTNGKIYEVKKSKLPTSGLCIIDDQDSERYLEGILARLNNGSTGVQFEIIEEEEEMQYTEKDLKEGTKLRCTHSKPAHWTVGKVYEVSSGNIGELSITDNDGSPAFKNYMLDCLNGNHNPVSFEIVEEEKEMKKYAKITKYFGRFNTDKRNGLEIGKEYEIVRFNGVSEDCWIYLNDKRPEYYISRIQYKLVEKELPTLKANVNVDTLEVIEAKIEQLANEETNLYNKRMRIKEQEESLREKRMKLKEAKKALEFLKKQNYL